MANLFGKLGLADTDRVFTSTVGQRAIYGVATEYVARVNAEVEAALSVFVDETTSDFKFRYKLPGGGTLSRRGRDGTYGAAKVTGQWDVAFPLEDFGREIAGDDVSMAYMTAADLTRHLQTVTAQYVNTVRFEMLKALFSNLQRTFPDPLHGDLLVEPLANGDATVYPPVIGVEAEATEDHYLEAGYLAAAISNVNNPYPVMRDDLAHHNRLRGDGYNMVAFIHGDEQPETEDLTSFTEVSDRFIQEGVQTARVLGLPAGLPGVVIGRTDDIWVVRWDWIPTGYMLTVDLDQPAPLVRRVDPEDTALWRGGIALVARDEEFPFESSTWRIRFGLGVGNRLNGVVMELAAGGGYTIPAIYQ